MSAPGGPLARFTAAKDRGRLPRLGDAGKRRSALLGAAKDFRKWQLTDLADLRKRLDADLKKLTRRARR